MRWELHSGILLAATVGRSIVLIVAAFACGFLAGRGDAQPPASTARRLAEIRRPPYTTCPLEALLGLERASASEAVAKLAAGLPAEAGAYTPLQRHPGSRTILQDAFVRFHGMLFQHSPPLLPLHEWGARGPRDKNFSNYGAPGTVMHAAMRLSEGRSAGHARPSVLTRLAHNGWIIGQAERTLPNSTCLGWDNTEYIEAESMPGCRERWVFRFANQRSVIDRRHRVIAGDLAVAAPGSEAMFDSIVCNFVFEHVARPFQAIAVIVSMLRPRGFLFWCAPFNERFHLVPGDFYRYTVMGAQQLVRDAGLSVLHTQRWGDSMITSGYMMGFGSGDFSPRYLEKHMLKEVGSNVKWLNKKPHYLYIDVGIVAQKPDIGGAATQEGLRARPSLARSSARRVTQRGASTQTRRAAVREGGVFALK